MTVSAAELVAAATAVTENLGPEQVARELADGALVVDVREEAECTAGTIPGALHVPRGLLEFRADPRHPLHCGEMDPDRRTILYCASGGRSALAAKALQELGYSDVAHLAGGMQAWAAAGRPTAGV